VTSVWWSDDDQLLAALDAGLRAARCVPRDFVEAGKAAYAWYEIDAERAALTYDSEQALAWTRSDPHQPMDPAALRALTYTSAKLTIEIEVTPDALLGQLAPGRPAEIEVQDLGGVVGTVTANEIGCFTIRPVPAGLFRLRCHAGAELSVLTGWIVP
jgi:hypothetical protein